RGPLYEFLKEIGRDMSDCGQRPPLGHFSEILRDSSTSVGMTQNWLVAHLNELVDDDFDLLARSTMKFSIVHCPRSHDYFGHSPVQFHKLRELGFNICLGTDSLASNDDLSLFAEMRAFHKKFPALKPEKTLELVTINSARALRREHELGKISQNFLADMIAIPFRDAASVYQTILNFVGQFPWSMLHGKITDTL